MNHVQQFLLSGGSVQDLKDKFNLNVKPHKYYPELVNIKYNSLVDSDWNNLMVCESRGLILNRDDNWATVARGYDKFFRYNEKQVANVNYNKCRYYTKADGSLMTMWSYKGEWHVSTTGSADAGGNVGELEQTFDEFFWKVYYSHQSSLPSIDCGYVFFFELMAKENRVVVVHENPSLVLLGGRKTSDWKEVWPEEISHLVPNIPVIKGHKFSSLQEALDSLIGVSGLKMEGYVAVDDDFNRGKIKNLDYDKWHYMRSTMTVKSFVDIVRTGETSEGIAGFPEFKPQLEEISKRYEELISKVEFDYNKYKDIVVQKDFALVVKGLPYSGALFNLRAKKINSIREFYAKCNIDSLIEILGY